MISYNLLNDKLFEYLEGTQIEDLNFLKSLNEIILKNPFNRNLLKYNEKMGLDYTVSLAYTFFKYLSEDYALYFEKRINDGTILFSDCYPNGQSYYDNVNNKRVIEIPITSTIEDAFVLVHETLHDMNLRPHIASECRMLYTETISMLGEILFEDFLIKYHLHEKDNKRVIHNSFVYVSSMAESNDFDLKLMSEFINNGYVNTSFFKDLCLNYDEDIIDNTLTSLINNSSLELDINQRYIIGCLFSCYMHDRIKDNPKYLCEFIETNSMMPDVFFEDLINYLELSIIEDDEHLLFTPNSLEKLEKCYKKEIKNR